MSQNGFAKVNGTVDHRLFLISLQYTRDNRLCSDSVPSVVNDNGAESIETGMIDRGVNAYALKIVARRDERRSVAAELFVMIPHVESQREEYVVPDKHLHFRFLTGINRHNISVNYGHRASRRSRYEVTVNFEYRSLAKQPLRKIVPRQFPRCLELLVPVSRLSGDVLFVAKLGGECCKEYTFF